MSVSSDSMYWNAVVVQRWRLDDDTESADERDSREQPEHEPIKHHRHELPVLLHLCTTTCESDPSHLLRSKFCSRSAGENQPHERNPIRQSPL